MRLVLNKYHYGYSHCNQSHAGCYFIPLCNAIFYETPHAVMYTSINCCQYTIVIKLNEIQERILQNYYNILKMFHRYVTYLEDSKFPTTY